MANQLIADLGTGTGTLARGLLQSGNTVLGLDPDAEMLAAAKKMPGNQQISFKQASAEETGLASHSCDIVSAGQCWHWFDPVLATSEIKRILKPTGQLLIAYYDWLPLQGNVVQSTERLIEQHNPKWRGGNQFGIHPRIFRQLGEAGFFDIQSFTYDEPAIYSHEAWRGRIRASAGVGATLGQDEIMKFDKQLSQILQQDFPSDPLVVPHRVFALVAKPPVASN